METLCSELDYYLEIAGRFDFESLDAEFKKLLDEIRKNKNLTKEEVIDMVKALQKKTTKREEEAAKAKRKRGMYR